MFDRLSLRYRIALVIFLLEACMLASVLSVTLLQSRQAASNFNAESQQASLALLANLSITALLTSDFSDYQLYIQDVQKQPSLQRILLIDLMGRVVAASRVTDVGLRSDEAIRTGEAGWRFVPVDSAAGKLGTLAVQFSDTALTTTYRNTRNLALIIAIAGMFVVALVGLATGFALTRRLEFVTAAVRRFAGGDHTVRSDVAGGDEIALLSRNFDRMANAVGEQQRQLQEQNERIELLLDSTAEAIYGSDANGICTFVNPACLHMLGYRRQEEMIGKSIHELVHHTYPDGRPYPRELCKTRLATQQGQTMHADDEVYWRADGSSFPVEYRSHPMYRGGRLIGSVVAFSDISQRKQAEEQLRIAASAFDTQEALMITDAKSMILRVNRAFTAITGYSAADAVGQTPRLLHSGRHSEEFYRSMWETIHRTGGWQGEVWDRHKNGEICPKWLTITAVRDDNGAVTHYVSSHYDISERKDAEERINELAFYDQLTSLPNRTLLLDRLRQAMTASARNDSYGAVLFIDLDNFKTLNDTLGHDMGDLLLQQVAQRLTGCVRAGDTVARLGGDEFVVMLTSLSMNERDAATQIEAIGEKIIAALNQAFDLGSAPYHCTASIGATLFRGNLASTEDLLKQADLAMYKTKATGRNALRFFDPDMETAMTMRASLEADLREAVHAGQFLLHYQAQVVGDGQLTGAEALLRWRHPRRGMVSPAEFITLAEETGLILPLGQWVLETACTQLVLWATHPEFSGLTIAVNVSAQQFHQRNFVERVLSVLSNTGANPRRLKLELTESLLVSNLEEVMEKMSTLKAEGVGFSLDDFGTGYSSLSYLKRLPLDQLKIDQSFVRDVLSDPYDASIAKTIIALAHSLGLGVIAEGVETAAQRDFLASSGCHACQGFFFSRPLPIDGFEAFVRHG